LKTGFDHIEGMGCKSRGYAGSEAGNGLNQRRRETRMVVIHRFMELAYFVWRVTQKG
jgi:hypothetical protein